MLVPYKRFIAWEVEGEGDEDKSGVADPAWELNYKVSSQTGHYGDRDRPSCKRMLPCGCEQRISS